MLSQEEIYVRVVATVAAATGVDEEEIVPFSTLRGDLGAESIDFLDITFRLECEFDIKIPRSMLFPEADDLTITVDRICKYIEWRLRAAPVEQYK